MENRNSSLWLGLGVGSVIGALAYRFSRTSKARKLKRKVCDAFHKITGQAEDVLEEVKDKVADTGKAVADKVAEKTSDLADKAEDLKGKVHTIASEAKK
ncbi:MAG: YtxH domain-containing protein [Bacteroides thetaiotaomicron]|uniref:YtxH domain-containing protein n=1 Tax=Bacteroides thetaiotaomicron TaxID=818 RepID=A0A943HU74_BACT4|nr:YtxH domain-containing protein [Bacteroides thetaiotaomicron]